MYEIVIWMQSLIATLYLYSGPGIALTEKRKVSNTPIP
jgi:hypothetical protein